MAILLKIEKLNKQVNIGQTSLPILHDIDFSVNTGEKLAIVGASGSGKSTLLGLLAGMDLPSQGSIFHHDIDITTLSEDARAVWRSKYVGFVFQTFQLLPHLTALENVQLPLELLGKKNAKNEAQAMLEKVGLIHRLQQYPRVLSGGEQQRVALARAFVTQPQILFADEPTGSLDSATGETIQALMFELNAQFKTTLILVTHDRSLAARCDRVIELQAGKLLGTQVS